MAADFFNVAHNAEVNIEEGGVIYAKENADITATVNENGGILDITAITDILNVVNVKVGSAKINVDGKIYSGVDFSGTPWTDRTKDPVINGKGNISLKTNVMTEIEAGSSNGYLSSLAVSVAVLNSEINIGDGAKLISAGDIDASSNGSVTVKTAASAGRWKALPASSPWQTIKWNPV